MAQLNKTEWEALYGTSGTQFPDNTTGLISELIMRTFGKNASDSIPFTKNDSYTWPFPQVTASGTDTYTATLSPVITAYVVGQKFQVLFTNANGGAATMAFNGLAPLAITKNGATALAAGDIPAGSIKILAYDGTQLQIVGDGGGGGTAASTTFTPAGTIAATDVQAAIEELDTENQSALDLKSDALITFRTETASHTLDATDLASVNAGATLVIQMNVASANTLTVPLNATQAFPVGSVIFVDQIGAGQTTIVATGGVTLNSGDGLVIAVQYAGCVLKKTATDTWTVQGKLVL